MNIKKYIALSFILSLFCMNNVYASCTQEEINEFKKIEDQYKATYKFNKESKDYTITINVVNPEKYNLTIDNKIDLKKITSSDKTSITIIGVNAGRYIFKITGDNQCDEIEKTIDVTLPEYNIYAYDPLCEGIEEFYLCQPTYEKKVDRETFESRVNTYKRTKQKENIEKTEIEEQDSSGIISYIESNIIQSIIIMIFIILVLITIIVTIKTARKSRRLE